MKQTIICAMLFLVALSSFSQPTNSQSSFTQPDYLEISKNQKKAGNILLIGGASLIGTAIFIPKGDVIHEGINLGIYDTSEYKNDGIKNAFALAGFLSALGSIPLFTLSGVNRRKAASVSFKKENTIQLNNQNLVSTSFPALGVKVTL